MVIQPCCQNNLKNKTMDYHDWVGSCGGYICPDCGTSFPLSQYLNLVNQRTR